MSGTFFTAARGRLHGYTVKRRQRLVLCVAPTAALAPASIEAAVAEAFGVRPSVVVLTAEALAAYRTSAGKVKRSALRRAYDDGALVPCKTRAACRAASLPAPIALTLASLASHRRRRRRSILNNDCSSKWGIPRCTAEASAVQRGIPHFEEQSLLRIDRRRLRRCDAKEASVKAIGAGKEAARHAARVLHGTSAPSSYARRSALRFTLPADVRYAASASAVSTTTDGRTPNASATAASIDAGASAAVGATQSTRR